MNSDDHSHYLLTVCCKLLTTTMLKETGESDN